MSDRILNTGLEAADTRLSDPARVVTLLALGGYLLLSACLLWRSIVLRPYSDMLDWIVHYDQFRANGDLAGYLLAPHNFHRLPWTFAALALDMGVLGGTNLPLIALGTAGLGLAAALLAREAARAAPPGLALGAGTVAAMLALMAGNILDAATPINITYVQCVGLSVLAIVLAQPASEGTRGPWLGLAALACAMASAFGNAAGLALWPALAFVAWRQGDRRWLAAVTIVGAAFVALYAWGQSPGGAVGGATHDPAAAGLLFLNYLALPWTRAVPSLGWLGGLVVLALCLAALLLKGRADAPRAERVACALILFSLGTAAMAALGRVADGGASNVPLRYAVFLAPAHVGLLMLALPYADRLARTKPAGTGGVLAAIAVLLLGQQAAMGLAAVRTSDVTRRLVTDFQSGLRAPQMRQAIHPDLDHAAAVYASLRHRALYQRELNLGSPPPAGRLRTAEGRAKAPAAGISGAN
ncbi:hypothetical protein DJ021_17430 [Phenylobacterium hankyongense]|uniref:Glycosyltransferase RgtA/B/C/D-like domain-containing protein n=1 Tax=Phenylobacterium hankyongense TaxID=1813876 RepID=A0A328B8Y0_9CAUL|nr:hypothetical protein [Phenylobacterium hankyongense]RAK61458.1 hypothetical protein DJ021_17430 [Phenylobacterium hankyongense]